MSTQRLMTCLAGMAFCGLASNNVRANLVTFGVTGYVTIFEGDASVGWSIPINTPFHGTFTFDTTTPDSRPDDPSIAHYFNSIVSSSFWLGNDPLTDTGVSGRISITNDRDGFDTYTVGDSSVFFRGYGVNVGLFLDDHTATVFDDDSLPVIPPPLEAFGYNHWQILADSPGYEFGVVGTITSLTRMPEPTTALLLLGGAAMFLRRSRRL